MGSHEYSRFGKWRIKVNARFIWTLTAQLPRSHLMASTPHLSTISLTPDGLTIITQHPLLCYSWIHYTAQFDRIHFADEAHTHLTGFFACLSGEDNHVRFWDTRTGQLCGKPITMPDVVSIAFSPALNDQSLDDRLFFFFFFNIQHLYSAKSKLVLRRGRSMQDPTLGGVSTKGMWPWEEGVGEVF